MPAPEVLNLTDHAVLWAASDVDYYGMDKVSSPVEIRVRWEGSASVSGDPQDTVQATPTTVYVDRAVTVGSLMWHGELRDLPDPPTGLFLVVGYDVTPDLKGRNMQRTVTLARYSDLLPEVV